MLLRHCLEQGISKAALARQFGVSRRTIYDWIASGQLDREQIDQAVRYGPRRTMATKLDPYRRIIDERLREFDDLPAVRLFDERSKPRSARLPAIKTLETFDFAFQPPSRESRSRACTSSGSLSATRTWCCWGHLGLVSRT